MAVTRLEIESRQPFAENENFGDVGTYEQIDGTVHFTVDPDHPANSLITDLRLAPRDSNGVVHFSADFRILKPHDPEQGNHRIFF